MSDLTRSETGDVTHHNTPCTGTCCILDSTLGIRGLHPARTVELDFLLHSPAFAGWEEQSAKTCGAASVASALNAVLFSADQTAPSSADPATDPPDPPHRPPEAAPAAPPGEVGADPAPGAPARRVSEADVLNYYALWAAGAARAACCAALRGSCGLAPSTRNIGNHRLTQAPPAPPGI
jgi:hypothetical protein